jgi:hypothetical protein
MPKEESKLLIKINQGVPEEIQVPYNELIAKRQSETLSPDEYDELLRLTDQVEKIDAENIKYLIQCYSIEKKPMNFFRRVSDKI